MRINYALLFIILSATLGKAQTETKSLEEPSSFHPKDTWLVGAGATYLGLTAKGGMFAADQLWLGAEAEITNFLSKRREAGLFSRYYVGKGMMQGFVGAGVSYGYFRFGSWDIDNPRPTRTYYSFKLNALAARKFT